jgi:hypothetical protein
LVHKVCALSRQQGEEHRLLRAASLQCLSAMVIHSSLLSSLYFPDAFWQFFPPWGLGSLTIIMFPQIWFMKEHSYIFADFDEVVVSAFYSIDLLLILLFAFPLFCLFVQLIFMLRNNQLV